MVLVPHSEAAWLPALLTLFCVSLNKSAIDPVARVAFSLKTPADLHGPSRSAPLASMLASPVSGHFIVDTASILLCSCMSGRHSSEL